MNQFMKAQLTTMIISCESLKQGCAMAALKDDGRLGRDEKKYIAKINKATDKYLKELRSMIR